MNEMPQTIGHYDLLDELGYSDLYIVYFARDTRTGQHVALRLLGARFTGNAAARLKFINAAEEAAVYRHPNIVSVIDSGMFDDQPYMATEYVHGITLQQWLDQVNRVVAPAEAIAIANQIADGLDYIHRMNGLHGSVRARNVFITEDGRAILGDAGLINASLAACNGNYAEIYPEVEDLAYCSPEQTRGDRVLDARSDIYSLGVTTYRMVTGDLPFKAADSASMLIAVSDEMPIPPEAADKAISPGIAYVLRSVMAKQPGIRYGTAGEFAQALSDGLLWTRIGSTSSAASDGYVQTAYSGDGKRSRRRWPAVLMGIAILAVLFVLLFLFGTQPELRQRVAEVAGVSVQATEPAEMTVGASTSDTAPVTPADSAVPDDDAASSEDTGTDADANAAESVGANADAVTETMTETMTGTVAMASASDEAPDSTGEAAAPGDGQGTGQNNGDTDTDATIGDITAAEPLTASMALTDTSAITLTMGDSVTSTVASESSEDDSALILKPTATIDEEATDSATDMAAGTVTDTQTSPLRIALADSITGTNTTATSRPTAMATSTLRPTPTTRPSRTPSLTPTTAPPTASATATPRATATAKATSTPKPSATPVPPTATKTKTPVPPTATSEPTSTPKPSATSVPPTATSIPSTATSTNTPRPTSTPVPPTATNTNTPRPTATSTNTPRPTSTPIPPTATATSTSRPTNTPRPTSTPVPPTATNTNTPRPTATGTNTPRPTATPIPPTATNTTIPPTATPSNTPTTVPVDTSRLQLLLPGDGTSGGGEEVFEWSTTIQPGAGQAFELVFWPPNQDPLVYGFGLAAPTTSNRVNVNLSALDQVLGDLLQPGDYNWGLLLVQTEPYQRLQFLEQQRNFRYVRDSGGSSDGGGITPGD